MNIEWDETYSIGDTEIDRQHQHWIHLYNRLNNLMLSRGAKQLHEEKGTILKEMSEYVAYHFRSEEDYMRRIGYPEIEKHWRIHKDFHARVYRLYRDHSEKEIILNTELLGVLRCWLVGHIIECDQKIVAHLKKESGALTDD